MPDKVVDASVLAAIVFDEPRADEASSLISGVALYAPDLLPYELCNLARNKSLREPSRARAIAEALEVALPASLTLVPVPSLELLTIAMESGLTAYDAAYLWLAGRLDCPLVTFDERLARAARVTHQ